MKAWKGWLSGLLKIGLRQPRIRKRLIFELAQDYYPELGIRVPLGFNLVCPIPSPDAWYSFREIFIEGEYASAFQTIQPPDRWVDLGCHLGYFSLYLVRLRRQAIRGGDFRALLIDADERVEPGCQMVIAENQLAAHLRFEQGLVAEGERPMFFQQRGQMASSAEPEGPAEKTATVPVITADRILQVLPPPYDLVKVDIEGGEFEFLRHYRRLLDQARYLLCEWHSPPLEEGEDRLTKLAGACGFQPVQTVVPLHQVTVSGTARECGVILFKSTRPDPKQFSVAAQSPAGFSPS